MMLQNDSSLHDLNHTAIISILERHSAHPSSTLALNSETRCFSVIGIDGFIAYRFSGRHYIISVAGINAFMPDKEKLLRNFILWADKIGRVIVAVQMNKDDAKIYNRCGFKLNQIGASYILNLKDYSLSGTFFMKLRNKISRAKRSGIMVQEYGKDLSYNPKLKEQLMEIDNDWIKSKHAKKLEFLVGELGDIDNFDFSCKRLFVAMSDDQPVAYILYVRSFGVYAGWMHELTRKRSDAISGVMELINSTAIVSFSADNVNYLNLGFTPLTALDINNEINSAYNPLIGWIFRLLARYGRVIYPSQSQLQYKLKWAPKIIEPEYIAFGKSAGLGGLWSFLKLVKAV